MNNFIIKKAKYPGAIIMVFCFFLLSIASSLFGDDIASSPTKTLEWYIREGKTKTNQYYFDEAREVFEEGLERFPEDWRLNLYYIRLFKEVLDNIPKKAFNIVPYYEKRFEANPESPVACAGLGYAYLFGRKYVFAKQMAEKARNLDETSLPALHIQSLVKSRLRIQKDIKKEDVINEYNKLLESFPDFFEGYQELFETFRNSKDFHTDPAIDFKNNYERAKNCPDFDPIIYTAEIKIILSPDDESYYDNLEKTCRIYEKILSEDPTHAKIKLRLSRLCLNSNKTEKALSLLTELAREAPKFFEAGELLAEIYTARAEYEKANKILEPLVQGSMGSYKDYGAQYAKNLYRQGKLEEAETFLEQYIKKAGRHSTYYEEKYLGNLKSRSPEDKIKILSHIPFIVQKGSYCGPASLSMILQYWGIEVTQDEIGEVVFNKGIGTLTRSMQNYVRKLGFRARIFFPSKKAWKSMLDQDVPILVLKTTLGGGGHGVVLSGYDDIEETFIFHDPNFATPVESGYSLLDSKFFEKVDYCLLILPEENYDQYDLKEIKSSLSVKLRTVLSYIFIGSAIREGFFKGIFINTLFVFFFVGCSILMLRKIIYPPCPKQLKKFLFLCIFLEIILNLASFAFNSNVLVISLSSYHIALFLFFVFSLLWRLAFWLIEYYLPLVFFLKFLIICLILSILVYLDFIEILSMDSDYILIPFIFVFFIILYPLPLHIYISALLNLKKYRRSLKVLKKFFKKKSPVRTYHTSFMLESIIYLNLVQYDKAMDILKDFLTFRYLTRNHQVRTKTQILEILLLKLRENTGEEETVINEAEQIILELERYNLKTWKKAFLFSLKANLLLHKEKYEEAKPIIYAAELIFESRRLKLRIQKILEKARSLFNQFKHIRNFNIINRLILAVHDENSDEARQLFEQYSENLDLEFRQKAEVLTLSRFAQKNAPKKSEGSAS